MKFIVFMGLLLISTIAFGCLATSAQIGTSQEKEQKAKQAPPLEQMVLQSYQIDATLPRFYAFYLPAKPTSRTQAKAQNQRLKAAKNQTFALWCAQSRYRQIVSA
jgi:hypothetical protein